MTDYLEAQDTNLRQSEAISLSFRSDKEDDLTYFKADDETRALASFDVTAEEKEIHDIDNKIQTDKEKIKRLRQRLEPLRKNMDDIFTAINSAIDNKLYLLSPTVLQEWTQIKTYYPNDLQIIKDNIRELGRIIYKEYFHRIQPKYRKTVGKETQYELDAEKYAERFVEITKAENEKLIEEMRKEFPDDFKNNVFINFNCRSAA